MTACWFGLTQPERRSWKEASGEAFGDWPKRARGAASVQGCASPGYRRPADRAEVPVFEGVDTPLSRRSVSAEFSHLTGFPNMIANEMLR